MPLKRSIPLDLQKAQLTLLIERSGSSRYISKYISKNYCPEINIWGSYLENRMIQHVIKEKHIVRKSY